MWCCAEAIMAAQGNAFGWTSYSTPKATQAMSIVLLPDAAKLPPIPSSVKARHDPITSQRCITLHLYTQPPCRDIQQHSISSALLCSFSPGTSASPKEGGSDGVRKELAEIKSLIGTMAASGSTPLLANGHTASPTEGTHCFSTYLCNSLL